MNDAYGEEDELKSGLKLWADVGVSIGRSVEKAAQDNRQMIARLNANTPIQYQVATAGVYPSSGSLLLNLGNPDQGTYWEVKSIAIGGTDYNITAAGSAGIYVGGTALTGTGSGMNNLVDFTSALPNAAFYGTRQLYVGEQESIFAEVNGGTPGQTYVCNVIAAVYSSRAANGNVELTA